jgi:hypothetical protein
MSAESIAHACTCARTQVYTHWCIGGHLLSWSRCQCYPWAAYPLWSQGPGRRNVELCRQVRRPVVTGLNVWLERVHALAFFPKLLASTKAKRTLAWSYLWPSLAFSYLVFDKGDMEGVTKRLVLYPCYPRQPVQHAKRGTWQRLCCSV